jgi:hypothetical protein
MAQRMMAPKKLNGAQVAGFADRDQGHLCSAR